MTTAVPWDKLLLAWSGGGATSSFSPTPYGLGVVDIALINALRSRARLTRRRGGGPLYRVITFKILVTLVWIGYRSLQDRSRRPAA